MASSITVKVSGLRELGEAMRLLSTATSTKIARSMTNAAAQLVRKAAVAKAPESEQAHKVNPGGNQHRYVEVQPGNLKRNVIVRRIANTPLTSEHIVTVRGKKKDGYAARYARLVEHGTVNMSADPFMRPALDSNITAASNAMRDRGLKMVEEEAAKLSPKKS